MTAGSPHTVDSAANVLARPNPVAALRAVQRALVDACAAAHRDPNTVTLVAVSKTVPAERVVPVLAAEHRIFGENRVQEAKAKWPTLRATGPGLELHLIGPLQTNKVRDAVALFDVIHSVDRPSLCQALARECARQGRQPELLVQVNTGAEEQKAGVLPDHADGFLASCRDTFGLDIRGLMCIPPADTPPEPHFALLAEIAARHRLAWLSMGMSADFASAIRHGATHVRIGSAIFGARSQEGTRG
jgi:pyridoxal phosphate enzyme (YggS family)